MKGMITMYIYHTGAIGEAVREKIASAKVAVRGGASDSVSFTEVLHSKLDSIDTDVKPVGTDYPETASPIARTDASTLIYALQNADTDDTAAAVVNSLGLAGDGSGNYKADADKLISAINLFNASEGADDSIIKKQLSDLVPAFNALLSDLSASGSTSGYMYSDLLKTAVHTASDALANAGITADENGRLTFEPDKFSHAQLGSFFSTVITAAGNLSNYANAVFGSGSSLLDFLGTEDDDAAGSAASYYSTLMNTIM